MTPTLFDQLGTAFSGNMDDMQPLVITVLGSIMLIVFVLAVAGLIIRRVRGNVK